MISRLAFVKALFTGTLMMPFGEATGQGFINPGVFTRIIINGAGKQLLVYSAPTPALGNLVASISQGGTDKPGNTLIEGVTTYNGGLGTNNAVNIFGNTVSWFSAPAPNGTYTVQAGLTGLAGQQLNIAATALTGVLTVPQPPFGNTSVTALGATWNSTTAAECNGNFNNILGVLGEIISALDASGIL